MSATTELDKKRLHWLLAESNFAAVLECCRQSLLPGDAVLVLGEMTKVLGSSKGSDLIKYFANSCPIYVLQEDLELYSVQTTTDFFMIINSDQVADLVLEYDLHVRII